MMVKVPSKAHTPLVSLFPQQSFLIWLRRNLQGGHAHVLVMVHTQGRQTCPVGLKIRGSVGDCALFLPGIAQGFGGAALGQVVFDRACHINTNIGISSVTNPILFESLEKLLFALHLQESPCHFPQLGKFSLTKQFLQALVCPYMHSLLVLEKDWLQPLSLQDFFVLFRQWFSLASTNLTQAEEQAHRTYNWK